MIKVENLEGRSIIEKVDQEGQGHVFRWWDDLSEPSRKKLLDQLRSIDFALLRELREKSLCSAEKNRHLVPEKLKTLGVVVQRIPKNLTVGEIDDTPCALISIDPAADLQEGRLKKPDVDHVSPRTSPNSIRSPAR